MIEDNEGNINKPLIYAIAGVALLIIAVSGSAYAYFSAVATSSGDAIKGSTFSISMNVKVDKVSADGEKGSSLIPIYDGTVTNHETNQLEQALTQDSNCIDKNNYTVCQVYKVTITNAGTNATTVNTSVSLTQKTTNTKWAIMSGRYTFGSIPTDSFLSKDLALPGKTGNTDGEADIKYFVVYLMNTGAEQSDEMNQEIKGIVTVTASTGEKIEATF